MRTVIGLSLLFVAGGASAQVDPCAAFQARPLSGPAALSQPLAPELAAPASQPGTAGGVLAQAYEDALSVDEVLLRGKLQACLIAHAPPRTTPGMPDSTDPAAYKPKTQFDNTPWRFDMNQNGKRMTADEFSAWMKARGVRVARGAAPAAAPPEPVEPAPPADGKDD